MWKLYENIYIFQPQKRIVSAETISGNTVPFTFFPNLIIAIMGSLEQGFLQNTPVDNPRSPTTEKSNDQKLTLCP